MQACSERRPLRQIGPRALTLADAGNAGTGPTCGRYFTYKKIRPLLMVQQEALWIMHLR